MLDRLMHKPVNKCEFFADWLRDARPGEQIIYHSGNLAISAENNRTVKELRQAVQEAYDDGLII
jgi:hypothetical protein